MVEKMAKVNFSLNILSIVAWRWQNTKSTVLFKCSSDHCYLSYRIVQDKFQIHCKKAGASQFELCIGFFDNSNNGSGVFAFSKPIF